MVDVPINDQSSKIKHKHVFLKFLYHISSKRIFRVTPSSTNSFAGFSYNKFLTITLFMTLKKTQSASSCSKPLYQQRKTLTQLMICINSLFFMIFELIKKYSNAFGSSVSTNIIPFNENFSDSIIIVLLKIEIAFTWYLQNNSWFWIDWELLFKS